MGSAHQEVGGDGLGQGPAGPLEAQVAEGELGRGSQDGPRRRRSVAPDPNLDRGGDGSDRSLARRTTEGRRKAAGRARRGGRWPDPVRWRALRVVLRRPWRGGFELGPAGVHGGYGRRPRAARVKGRGGEREEEREGRGRSSPRAAREKGKGGEREEEREGRGRSSPATGGSVGSLHG